MLGWVTRPLRALRPTEAEAEETARYEPEREIARRLEGLRTVLEMPRNVDEILREMLETLKSVDAAFWATHDQVALLNEQVARVMKLTEPLEPVAFRAQRIQQVMRRQGRRTPPSSTADTPEPSRAAGPEAAPAEPPLAPPEAADSAPTAARARRRTPRDSPPSE
jgi:hypothetical protein